MKNSFKTLSFPELRVKRNELSRKYMDFRFQCIIGHVDNPLQKRELRRQIARLNTLIRQHELARQRESAGVKPQQESAGEKVQKA